MFKTKKSAPQAHRPIPTANQEWPNQNETWAEFMVRIDYEESAPTTIAFVLASCILCAFVVWILIDALDKASL